MSLLGKGKTRFDFLVCSRPDAIWEIALWGGSLARSRGRLLTNGHWEPEVSNLVVLEELSPTNSHTQILPFRNRCFFKLLNLEIIYFSAIDNFGECSYLCPYHFQKPWKTLICLQKRAKLLSQTGERLYLQVPAWPSIINWGLFDSWRQSCVIQISTDATLSLRAEENWYQHLIHTVWKSSTLPRYLFPDGLKYSYPHLALFCFCSVSKQILSLLHRCYHFVNYQLNPFPIQAHSWAYT